jgi:hypothetical protein
MQKLSALRKPKLKKPKRRVRILVEKEVYDKLAELANHYNTNINIIADACLLHGLQNEELIERCVAKIKRRSKENVSLQR